MQTARPVSWTLGDCGWAAVPTLLLAALGVIVTKRLPKPPAELLVHPGVLITASVLTAATLLLPIYFIAIRKRGARLADFGIVAAPLWESIGLLGITFLTNFGVNSVWYRIARRFGIPLQPDGLKQFGPGLEGFILALILGAVIAPIVEEIFFRAFLFGALRKTHPFWIAAWTSGVIFGAAHMVPGAILPLSVAGFLSAWLRERTGSIWPSIAAHMLNNAWYYAVLFAVHHHLHT
jgi:membrane protease YdiL (CAAX protease family)